MGLSVFIEGLLADGAVHVAGDMGSFDQADLDAAVVLLRQYHNRDRLDMPGTAPAFDGDAAIWAARYLYQAIQLVLLRNLGEEVVSFYLTPYEKTPSAAVVYSADLCFRHLPGLLSLARGFAPDDPLVVHVKETLRAWPFSAASVELPGEVDLSVILSDRSLKQAYIDRIIDCRNIKKAVKEPVRSLVLEVLGDHAAILWPEFTLSA